jgi:carboxypeptidase Q
LRVTTISPRHFPRSDHSAFDAFGIPAFQFMQDPLEYHSRTHHSNIDTVDHVIKDYLAQVAVAAAVVVYQAAMADKILPRKAPAKSHLVPQRH